MATDGYTPGSGSPVAANQQDGQAWQYVEVGFDDPSGNPQQASAAHPFPSADAATLAAVQALGTALATAAGQASSLAQLQAIVAKLSADPASQTTLAAINTKLGGTLAVALPTVVASPPLNIRKTVTTAGTAVALSASALVVRRALVTALTTNGGVIVPGGSGVVAASGSRNGPGLNPGDAVSLEYVDLSTVFIDSTVNGEGVTVLYQV